MKKVVCFALLTLSALAAPPATVDLLDANGVVGGSAVVTSIPGQLRVQARIQLGGPGFSGRWKP